MTMLTSEVFLDGVRQLVAERLDRIGAVVKSGLSMSQLMPGKMLRTRLAGDLAEAVPSAVPVSRLSRACAATELVHTASLCHDDVIDNAFLRRRQPSLWRIKGPSGAVLVGDLLLCEAMLLIVGTEEGRFVPQFLAAVREVCAAEVEQEIGLRGIQPDEETCLRIARQKTGPLFAFTARFCGGDDAELSLALAEAGYNVGTAYQLVDDLLDVAGSEQSAGKTLGTDSQRSKFTLAHDSMGGAGEIGKQISRLVRNAVGRLEPWPTARRGLEKFLTEHLRGAVELQLQGCGIDVTFGLAV